MILTEESWYWEGKPLPLTLCPAQTSHGLAYNWSQLSPVVGQHLTASVMAQL